MSGSESDRKRAEDVYRRMEQFEEVVESRLNKLESTDVILQLELNVLLDEVIGPQVLGVTGEPIMNGHGLPLRDRKLGLASRLGPSTPMKVAVISAAAVIIAAFIPEVFDTFKLIGS